MIEKGYPVAFRHHIKDILKHYDVIQVPKSFLGDLKLPDQGRFFMIQPENPEVFWSSKISSLHTEHISRINSSIE
jgi:hypothetical protein